MRHLTGLHQLSDKSQSCERLSLASKPGYVAQASRMDAGLKVDRSLLSNDVHDMHNDDQITARFHLGSVRIIGRKEQRWPLKGN